MPQTTHVLLGFVAACTVAFAPLAARGGDAPPATPPEEPKALSFPVSYTGEFLGNPFGGYKQGAIVEGLLNVGVQGNLEKLIGWQGGSFLVSVLDPHGPSLTEKYVHDFNRVSNIDAYDSVRLYEAWLQQEWDDGKFSLRAGQILADTEFFLSDNAALFMNGAFGVLPVVSQNLSAAVFPVPAPGVRFRWKATDALSFQAGVFDGDVGDQSEGNKHGVDWRIGRDGGVLAVTEAAYTWNGQKDAKGLPGDVKLGAFFRNAGEEAKDDFAEGTPRIDAGGYVIADQQLWRKPGTEDQGLSAFARIGGAPDARNTVPFYADGGFTYKGLFAGREKDVAGLAFSCTRVGNSLDNDDGTAAETHHETILEATYKAQIKEWLSVQPDVQYVFNPGAFTKADNALVAGIRLNVSF